MTLTNAYCTLAQFEQTIGQPGLPQDLDNYERAINTASRWVDQHCGRRFYADAAPSARQFWSCDGYQVAIDDVSTTTGLQVATGDGYVQSITDYVLYPLNRVGPNGATSWPYTSLVSPTVPFQATAGQPNVQVTAAWGWSATPDDVTQACIHAAEYIFKAKDAPFGAAGISDLGITRAKMPSVVLDLLVTYRTYGAVGLPMVG